MFYNNKCLVHGDYAENRITRSFEFASLTWRITLIVVTLKHDAHTTCKRKYAVSKYVLRLTRFFFDILIIYHQERFKNCVFCNWRSYSYCSCKEWKNLLMYINRIRNNAALNLLERWCTREHLSVNPENHLSGKWNRLGRDSCIHVIHS